MEEREREKSSINWLKGSGLAAFSFHSAAEKNRGYIVSVQSPFNISQFDIITLWLYYVLSVPQKGFHGPT